MYSLTILIPSPLSLKLGGAWGQGYNLVLGKGTTQLIEFSTSAGTPIINLMYTI